MSYILEVCADSVRSAIAAQEGGADRIELCSGLVIGGLSPTPSMFREVKRNTDLRIRVLLRPRFGDFCYDEYEFRTLKEEVEQFRELGAGIRPDVIPELAACTGIKSFHLSGKMVIDSRMEFRREGIPMGIPGSNEFEIWQTDEEQVRRAAEVLKRLERA